MYPPVMIAAIMVGILHLGDIMKEYLKYKKYAHFDKKMSILNGKSDNFGIFRISTIDSRVLI